MPQSNTANTGPGHFLATPTQYLLPEMKAPNIQPLNDKRYGRYWHCCDCKSKNQMSDVECQSCDHMKCRECLGFNGA
ncbi:hypothetical protein L873DRAFT_1805664, partial [Choiromyces venosus 120613-1]